MNEEVKNDLENENAIEALRAEMMDFIPNWGPESDVRTIAEPKGDDQQRMILWAMSWHNIAFIMAMMYACLPTTVHEFFELSNWRYVLYSALINTLWIDERSGLEYSLSFREASAVIAFFTGVRGGDKGCYLDGPYCCITMRVELWEGAFLRWSCTFSRDRLTWAELSSMAVRVELWEGA